MTSSLYTCSCSSSSLTWLLKKRNVDHYGGFSLRRRALPVVALSQSRRSTAFLISSLPFTFVFLSPPPPAEARERRKKKNIPIDDYITSRISFFTQHSHLLLNYLLYQIIFYFHFSSALYKLIQKLVMFDSADGLKYYDFLEGKGPIAEKGSTVQVCHLLEIKGKYVIHFFWICYYLLFISYCSCWQVHFDCLYRGITAVSSRESKLLAGNRVIAQVPIICLFGFSVHVCVCLREMRSIG